jgi:hypothetical protein
VNSVIEIVGKKGSKASAHITSSLLSKSLSSTKHPFSLALSPSLLGLGKAGKMQEILYFSCKILSLISCQKNFSFAGNFQKLQEFRGLKR